MGRICVACGPISVEDQRKKTVHNLSAYDGELLHFTFTAPGDDVLPRDADGRILDAARYEWNTTVVKRWSRMYEAAVKEVKSELGYTCPLLVRAFAIQQRGAYHVHGVIGAKTERERRYAYRLITALEKRARQYNFGPRVWSGIGRSAQELAHYIADNFANERSMGVQREELAVAPIYVARSLTMLTGVTMRLLRRIRWCRIWLRAVLSERESNLVLALSGGAVYVAPARAP